jgi:TatD DNase family protein
VADLIDTHAHLDDEQFQADLPAVLDRARAAGLIGVVTVATTAASTRASLALAVAHPLLHAGAGIHPNSAAAAAPGDWDTVAALAADPHIAGIGETGLDRYRDHTPFATQEDYFARHLRLARQLNKPIIIHCREADADVERMLREEHDRSGPIRGVMHSFSGGREFAEACLAMGLHISFAGMLTYKNAAPLREVAARIPLDCVLVETDSPYLAPVPMRGRRNEPAFVAHTAACLAGLLGLSADRLAEQSTANARALFGLEQR